MLPTIQSQTSNVPSASATDDFFNLLKTENFSESRDKDAEQEVTNYLLNTTNISGLTPVMKKLFVRYNTAVPSSAHCERLFSAAGQIFSDRRAKLADKNFEIQLLLKFNKYFTK